MLYLPTRVCAANTFSFWKGLGIRMPPICMSPALRTYIHITTAIANNTTSDGQPARPRGCQKFQAALFLSLPIAEDNDDQHECCIRAVH